MKAKASAFAPGQVTGFFSISDDPPGSTGSGFCVELGVRTDVNVAASNTNLVELKLNGRKEHLPTSSEVVKRFLELSEKHWSIEVHHRAQLPVGYGFGMSGAGALSLAMALNKALKTKLDELEAARIAHEAEIACGTGLGTVIAVRHGGFGVRKEPSSFDAYDAIRYPAGLRAVLAPIRPLSTQKIIRDASWKERISGIGSACVHDIGSELGVQSFLRLSRLFATESGLAQRDVLSAMRESGGSMAMLGESVFVLADSPKKASGAAAVLKKYAKNVFITKISKKGARLLL